MDFQEEETVEVACDAQPSAATPTGPGAAKAARAGRRVPPAPQSSTGPGAGKAPGAGSRVAELEGSQDATRRVARELRLNRPYLLCDVEIMNRERAASVRDELSQAAREVWKEDALGQGDEVLPLPPLGGRSLA